MIVKNCPAYLKQHHGACNERWNAQDIESVFCKDYSDCVIKQVYNKLSGHAITQEISEMLGVESTPR